MSHRRGVGLSTFCPGKLILTGEHSVVYGYSALVASINKGVRVIVKKGLGKVDLGRAKDPIGLVKKTIKLSGLNRLKVDIKIESEMPVGSGLGSSAAVSAGVIRAGYDFLGKKLSEGEWYRLTMEGEKLAHENPSGVDPAAVIYQGLIKYIKDKGIERLKIRKPLELLLFQSGKPEESTREMVGIVSSKLKMQREKYKKILREIGKVTEKICRALEKGDGVGDLINQNGKLLEKLGVVGKKAQKKSKKLRDLGCGVKIAGAGGLSGGSGMVMVYHTDLNIPRKYLESKKYEYMKVVVGDK